MPAITNDFDSAASNWSFCKSAPYHLKEKPAQTDANLPALKLKAIMTKAGM